MRLAKMEETIEPEGSFKYCPGESSQFSRERDGFARRLRDAGLASWQGCRPVGFDNAKAHKRITNSSASRESELPGQFQDWHMQAHGYGKCARRDNISFRALAIHRTASHVKNSFTSSWRLCTCYDA